jgi:beta-mannosidase
LIPERQNMKKQWFLDSGWSLWDEEGKCYPIPQMPMQVHSVLRLTGVISDRYIWGDTQDCRWVQEKKWIYQVEFPFEEAPQNTYLLLPGVDTFADIYLNGEQIGSCEDFYLSYRFPIERYLQRKNVLRVVFRSAPEEIHRAAAHNPHPDKISDFRMVRKNFHDSISYLGAKPDLMRIGLYAPVSIEKEDHSAFIDFHIEYTLNDGLNQVQVQTETTVTSPYTLRIQVWDPEGTLCYFKESTQLQMSFCLENPQLWYPKGSGPQALY